MLLVEKIIDTYKEKTEGYGYPVVNDRLFNLTPLELLEEFNSLTEQEKDCYIDFVLSYKGSEEEKQALKEDLSDGEFAGQGVFKAVLDKLDVVLPYYFVHSHIVDIEGSLNFETSESLIDILRETADNLEPHYSDLDTLIVSLKNCA